MCKTSWTRSRFDMLVLVDLPATARCAGEEEEKEEGGEGGGEEGNTEKRIDINVFRATTRRLRQIYSSQNHGCGSCDRCHGRLVVHQSFQTYTDAITLGNVPFELHVYIAKSKTAYRSRIKTNESSEMKMGDTTTSLFALDCEGSEGEGTAIVAAIRTSREDDWLYNIRVNFPGRTKKITEKFYVEDGTSEAKKEQD